MVPIYNASIPPIALFYLFPHHHHHVPAINNNIDALNLVIYRCEFVHSFNSLYIWRLWHFVFKLSSHHHPHHFNNKIDWKLVSLCHNFNNILFYLLYFLRSICSICLYFLFPIPITYRNLPYCSLLLSLLVLYTHLYICDIEMLYYRTFVTFHVF